MFQNLPQIREKQFFPPQWGIDGSDNPLGLRTNPESEVYYVHSENPNANDANWGTDPEHPMSTILAGYNRLTAGQNDVLVVVGQNTPYPIAADFDWAKDFTHLIGVSTNLYGEGQRVRIEASAALDLTVVMTISAKGSYFRNIKFFNYNDAAADSGAVLLDGANRCVFENIQFAGMGSAVAAARAGSYSLKLDAAEENQFVRCVIGLDTISRAAANAELVMDGSGYRNYFDKCIFKSLSVTAGKFLVSLLATNVPWVTIFEDCLFSNLNMTGGGAAGALITDAFNDASTAHHQIILRGKTQFVGCTGVANTLTHIWSAEPVPNTGFGISVNPAG
jgi:hypothetical protein